jgi:hypothetical protein
MTQPKEPTVLKMTKIAYMSFPKHLRRRHKDGTKWLFVRNTKTWVQVTWDS